MTLRSAAWCGWLAKVLLALCVAAPAGAESLTLFADIGYPPLVYLDKASSQPAGQLVEMLSQAQALTGDRYVIELMPWVRAYQMALRGQGGLLGASRTPEREELFDFSAALMSDDIHAVTRRADGLVIRGVGDLRGRRVGAVRGVSYGPALDRAAASGQLLLERDNCQRTQLRRLLLGQLDAALVGNGALGFELQWRGHRELEARRDELQWQPVPLVRSSLHVAFHKSMGRQAALGRLDAALARLQAPELHGGVALALDGACAE